MRPTGKKRERDSPGSSSSPVRQKLKSGSPAAFDSDIHSEEQSQGDVRDNVLGDQTHPSTSEEHVVVPNSRPLLLPTFFGIVQQCVIDSKGTLRADDLNSVETCEAVVGLAKIHDLVQDFFRTKSIEATREFLQSRQPVVMAPTTNTIADTLKDPAEEATRRAWLTPFRRMDRASMILDILQDYCQQQHSNYFARYTTYFQSSGTGKSRMMEELANYVVRIPVNLLEMGAGGYPPGDRVAEQLLSGTTSDGSPYDPKQYQRRVQGFLFGLLKETLHRLKDISEDTPQRARHLAQEFRQKMAQIESYSSQGSYRQEFYDDVFRRATEFEELAQEDHIPRSPTPRFRAGQLGSVYDAASELCSFIGNSQSSLAVLITFDEAHKLIQNDDDVLGLDRFSELRRSLHLVVDQPIFSVSISTAGKFDMPSPAPRYAPSSRLTGQKLGLYPPLIEVGFDDFADKVRLNEGWTLDRLASTHRIAHLGRALFATRYDSGGDEVKQDMLSFAQSKLLCGASFDPTNPVHTLACLAPRLCLDFAPSTRWSDRKMERLQVERHMRICLDASEGFREMITASSSEPLLAEAARVAMHENPLRPSPDSGPPVPWPAYALQLQMKEDFLNVGTRGEIAAALLLMLAADKAMCDSPATAPREVPQDFSIPSEKFKHDAYEKGRIIDVCALLAALINAQDVSWRSQLPSAVGFPQDRQKTLDDAFDGCHIWFNHFVKVHDRDTLNEDFLLRILVRGAAVICVDEQFFIHIIIPYLRGNEFRKENIGVFLVQVQNDLAYGSSPHAHLFDAMKPSAIGMSANPNRPPTLRLVFALAVTGESAGVVCPPSPIHAEQGGTADTLEHLTYDIWFAGATAKTFGVVTPQDEPWYERILGWGGIRPHAPISTMFDLDPARDIQQTRCQMQPAAGTDHIHFNNFAPWD